MAKFAFPVPTRRSKQGGFTPISPTSGPPAGYSKAHQILGGIGDVAPLAPVMGGGDGGSMAWEAESDTLPMHLRNRDVGLVARRGATGGDPTSSPSDESERLRREGSNASMREWYDKSKLPLSISQQTSASAMAKGLPNKASALLDMDNELSIPSSQAQGKVMMMMMMMMMNDKKKKKPHGLDLAGLLRGKRGKSAQDDDVLETELYSAGSTPSPGRHHRPWASRREARKEPEPVRPHTSASHKKKETANVALLDRMYRHYEAMTNRDNSENNARAEPPVPPGLCAEDGAWPLQPRQSAGPLSTLPSTAAAGASSETASISSHQTRASKGTMQGIRFESDLKLMSMLSLSSGSEDSADEDDGEEMAEGVEAFLLEASRGTTPITRGFAADDEAGDAVGPMRFTRHGDLPAGMVPSIKSSKTKRESYASTDTYLTVPSQTASRKSAKLSTPGSGSHGQSRLSTMSASTTASTASWASAPHGVFPTPVASPPTSALPMPPNPKSNNQRDNAAVPPGLTCSFDRHPSTRSNNSIRTTQSMGQLNQLSPPTQFRNHHHRNTNNHDNLNHSNSQATPPLTPSSIDAFLRSANPASTTLLPHSSSSSAEPPTDASTETSSDESRLNTNRDSHASINPRFMQVTQQEELLLAALRQKRALMRQDPDTVDFADVDYSRSGNSPPRSDSQISSASSGRGGCSTLSRSSTRTLTETSYAAQPRDALGVSIMSQDEQPPRSRRTRHYAPPTRLQPSSARSSATISRRPSARDSLVSPRSGGRRSEDVPLFLDEGSIPEHDRPRVQRQHSQSPSAPPIRSSFQTLGSRPSSRARLQQHPTPPTIDESDPCPDLDDFMEHGERTGDDEDKLGGAETDGDADFEFPVPGGRGSINVGVSNSNGTSNILPIPTPRSSGLRKADRFGGKRTPQRSPTASPSNGVLYGRRDAAGAISVSIPEDAVCEMPDPMWTNMAPLPPPPAENGRKGSVGAIPAIGVPRPDSPPLTPDDTVRRHKKAARLSAVGGRGGMEPGWWAHDG